MYRYLHILFLFTIVNAIASPITINDSTKEFWVGNKFSSFIEDAHSNYTFSDVSSEKTSSSFKKDDNHNPLNYNTESTYWQRFLLIDKRKKNTPLRLEFFDFNTDEIELFIPIENNTYQSYKSGYSLPFDTRQVQHKNVSFSIPKMPQDSSYIYVKYKSSKHNVLKPVLRSYDQVFNYSLKEYILLGVFFGVLILMIFYNLLYFILLRDLNYLFYVLFAIGSLIFLMAQNGLGFQFLWPNIPSLNNYMSNTSLFISGISMLLFTHSFFNIKRTQKKLHRLLQLLIGSRILLFALEIFIYPKSEWIIIDIFYVQIVLAIGVFAYLKGVKSSTWFVLAFLFLDISFLISFFEKSGWIDSSVFTVYSLYGGIILQFVFLSISIAEAIKETYSERNKAQKQLILEFKKNESLKEKVNRELEQKVKERTTEVEKQKNIVQEQNNQILSSVRYAKTIQNSSLPGQVLIESILKDHFILFKPRDIVSGDFYWIHELPNNQYIVAAVDCTGHGIPGAFMSMIGINLLNRIVADGTTEPHLVLSELHKNIQIALKQQNTRNSDGMDMAICLVDRNEKNIKYSGARNPLIYCQKGKTERIRATRKSVGGAEQEQSITFDQTEISYKDAPISIYLFSDGYPDQFGGEYDQKFMLGNFKKMIEENQSLTMVDQNKEFKSRLHTWMGGSNFQVDDILVIGIKEK